MLVRIMTTNLTPEEECDLLHYVLYSGPHTSLCRPYVAPSEEKMQADREEFKRVSKELLIKGAEYRKREKLSQRKGTET